MKSAPFRSLLIPLALFFIAACDISNPRGRRLIHDNHIEPLGPMTLAQLYSELENVDDNTSLPEGASAEGEINYIRPQRHQFQNEDATCLFTYPKASFEVSAGGALTLGLEVKTQTTPLQVENQTSGTQSVRESCQQQFDTLLPFVTKSTLVPALERKLVASNLKEFLQEIEHSCRVGERILGGPCKGLSYDIRKTNFFSAGTPLSAYEIKLHFTLAGQEHSFELTYSPLGLGILTGAILHLDAGLPLPGLRAGSLGEIKLLELTNLQ